MFPIFEIVLMHLSRIKHNLMMIKFLKYSKGIFGQSSDWLKFETANGNGDNDTSVKIDFASLLKSFCMFIL